MSGTQTFNNTVVGSSHYHLLWLLQNYCGIKERYDPHIHLSFVDLAVKNATSSAVISIQLKHSKTDPFMKGVEPVFGRT